MASKIQIVTSQMSSADTGAFGAYYLALPQVAKDEVASRAARIRRSNKAPVLPLLDIGGTKVRLVLAYIGDDGPTFQILQSYQFPTPVSTPNDFYKAVAALIAPPLKRIEESGFAELIPVLGVGQPGRFDNPKGPIGKGTALDLGTDFAGCLPYKLLASALSKAKRGVAVDAYFANDGRCQFVGIGAVRRSEDKAAWSKLAGEQVAYLGIGTGLGAGFGKIVGDGEIEPFEMVNAFDVEANDASFEQLDWPEVIASRFTKSYKYGDLLSGKFLRRFMHDVDCARLASATGRQAEPKDGPVFIPQSSARDLTPKQQRRLLLSDAATSPLSGILLNDLLSDEATGDETQEEVEFQRTRLEKKLDETLRDIASELDGTLLKHVRDGHYQEVIDAVVRTKRRGRHVQFMGIGKCHSIGRNLAYIFSNLGIDSASCELTGADSENLTNLNEEDLVFLISNSGRTAELLQMIPYLKRKHCRTVALVGDKSSPIARLCRHVIDASVEKNPSPIAEAPTTSTTAALAAGTAIGMVVSYLFDYDSEDFFLDHPNLQFRVKFPPDGVRADASFDRLAKVEDILRRFAKAIRALADDEKGFVSRMITLTKRILVSHYNNRAVFLTGSGASLRVAEKIAATLTSIGIDAEAVNPAQLPHGGFAHIRRSDLLVLISFSGETRHLIHIQELAREKGVDCAVITSEAESTLAKSCDAGSPSGLSVIAGSKATDKDLVPIPDQKILSSFINLTVGDTLAVILAEIIDATEERFAREGHQDGAFGRKVGRLREDLLETLGRSQAELIGQNEDQLKGINKELRIEVDGKDLEAYADRSGRGRDGSAQVMIFGMGAIGLAYLGPLVSPLRKPIWFVEQEEQRVEAMRRCNYCYKVKNGGKVETIGRVDAIPTSDKKAVLRTALRVDTILTAVGVANVENLLDTFRDIVRLRYQFRIVEPLNIVFCENFPVAEDPLASFRHNLREGLENPDLKVYFDGCVGLVPASDESQVPEVPPDAMGRVIVIEGDPAVLYVDEARWCNGTDGQAGQEGPQLGNSVQGARSFLPLHMRKLWVHNMAHAMIGYLGHFAGYVLVCRAIEDERIAEITRRAMRAIGKELYRRWSYQEKGQTTIDEYIDWRWKRYGNPELNDKVSRLCRDPVRKLGRVDRLLGAANYIRKYASPGEETDAELANLLVGVVAAIRYAEPKPGVGRDNLRARVLRDLVNIDSALLARAERSFEETFEAPAGSKVRRLIRT